MTSLNLYYLKSLKIMKNFLINWTTIRVFALLTIIATLVLSLGKYSAKDYYLKGISMVDTTEEVFILLMILNFITLVAMFIIALWIAVNKTKKL